MNNIKNFDSFLSENNTYRLEKDAKNILLLQDIECVSYYNPDFNNSLICVVTDYLCADLWKDNLQYLEWEDVYGGKAYLHYDKLGSDSASFPIRRRIESLDKTFKKNIVATKTIGIIKDLPKEVIAEFEKFITGKVNLDIDYPEYKKRRDIRRDRFK